MLGLHSIEASAGKKKAIKAESSHLDRQGVGRHTGWLLMLQDLLLISKPEKKPKRAQTLTWNTQVYVVSNYSTCSQKLQEIFDLNALVNPLELIPAVLLRGLSLHTYLMLVLLLGSLFHRNTTWRIPAGLFYRFLWGPRFILCVYSGSNMSIEGVSLRDFSIAFPDEGDKLSSVGEQDELMTDLIKKMHYHKGPKYITCDLCLFADQELVQHFVNEDTVRAWSAIVPSDVLHHQLMNRILVDGFAPCPAVAFTELVKRYPVPAATPDRKRQKA